LYAAEGRGEMKKELVLIPDPVEEKEEAVEVEGDKAGRRIRTEKAGFLRKLADDFIAGLSDFFKWADYDDKPEPESKIKSAVKIVEHDGKSYLVTWTTNAFIDRENEIFTTKSIQDYVARHKADSSKGHVMYRHYKGTDFADIIYQTMSGRFLVEISTFHDTPIGQAFKEMFIKYPNGHPNVSAEGWGTSHGYLYRDTDRKDGVYEW